MAKRRMVKYMLKNALRNSLSAATRSGIDPFDALIVGCYESRKLRYVSRVKPDSTGRYDGSFTNS